VQVGEVTLKLDQEVSGASKCCGCTSYADRGLDHRADHLGLLTHAEVIVDASPHDFAGTLRRPPSGAWKAAGDTLKFGEHSVASLVLKRVSASVKYES
jgi:hypothetical protein